MRDPFGYDRRLIATAETDAACTCASRRAVLPAPGSPRRRTESPLPSAVEVREGSASRPTRWCPAAATAAR